MLVIVVTPAEEVPAIGVSAGETAGALNFLEQSRMRYLAIPSRAKLIHAPAGTSHNVPYETKEFLLGVVRQPLAGKAATP